MDIGYEIINNHFKFILSSPNKRIGGYLSCALGWFFIYLEPPYSFWYFFEVLLNQFFMMKEGFTRATDP
jgi:hypothetical protein